jgi:hypothetical protein
MSDESILDELPADTRAAMAAREREAKAEIERETVTGFNFAQYAADLPRETVERMRLRDAQVAAQERADALAAVRSTIPADYRWAFGLREDVASTLVEPTRAELARVEAFCERWWVGAEQLATKRSAVLMGPAGIGKTSLAVRMLRVWFERRFQVGGHPPSLRFVHASELAEARMQHPIGHGEAPSVRDALACEVLVLDDLGRPLVEPARSAVADVVEGRHAAGRTTWITTGLTLDQVAARYDAGTARRVFERARPIDLTPSKGTPRGVPSPAPGVIAGTDYDPAKRRAGDST